MVWVKKQSQFFDEVATGAIWAKWQDIASWPDWHGDLAYCKLVGDFQAGSHFMLKPHDAPSVKILITNVKAGERFTNCTQFFGAKMYITHCVQPQDNGVLISNKVLISGTSSELEWRWVQQAGHGIVESLPKKMEKLITLIQQA